MNKIYKTMWYFAALLVVSMVVNISYAAASDDEEFTNELNLPTKYHPIIDEDDVVQEVVSKHKKDDGSSGVRIIKLDDGSYNYLTNGHGIQYENYVFTWEPGTFGNFIVFYEGNGFRLFVDDGIGINLKVI